jgi:hypothetical protein
MPEHGTVVTAPAATANRWQVRGWFYISAALFMIVLSVAGFGPSIVDQSQRNAPPTPMVIAHGIVGSAWLLMFLTQAILAATRRIAVHRRLGMVSPVIAVMMIVLGYTTTIEKARRGYDLSGDIARASAPPGSPSPSAVEFEALDLGTGLAGFLTFGVLVAAGLWYRRRPDIHKRLMLFALIPLAIEPIIHLTGYVVGHWPASQGVFGIIGIAIIIFVLSASAIFDKVLHGRIHPVSLWVPALIIVEDVVLRAVLPSAAWHEIAGWLVG